jgi:hypothetical protein
MTDEDILRLLGENANAGVEGQIESTRLGVEGALEQQRRQQEFLTEAANKAVEYYKPWSEAGQGYKSQMDQLMAGGAPQYQWSGSFKPETWKWDKGSYQAQPWDEYAKTHLGAENIKNSPFYDLYQWQNQQQQEAIDKGLRARGMYGSGAGMSDALKAKTGLEQQFTADEYNRALQNYMTGEQQKSTQFQDEYNKALQAHNITYEEAKQKYGMDYDQYNKTFGIQQGQYADRLAQLTGLTNYGYLADAASANARIGQGNQMGQGAIQTGQTMAGLYGQQGQGLANSYNAQNNTLMNLYGIQQGQANWNAANQANQNLGLGNLAAGVLRTGAGIYNQYNQPSSGTTGSNYYGGSYVPSNFWSGTGMPADTGGVDDYGNYYSWD